MHRRQVCTVFAAAAYHAGCCQAMVEAITDSTRLGQSAALPPCGAWRGVCQHRQQAPRNVRQQPHLLGSLPEGHDMDALGAVYIPLQHPQAARLIHLHNQRAE